MYYQSSENKSADQLRGYREADLRLCFSHMQIVGFSHEAAQMLQWLSTSWNFVCYHIAWNKFFLFYFDNKMVLSTSIVRF